MNAAADGQTAKRSDVQAPRRVLGAQAAPSLIACTFDTILEHAPVQFVVQSILPRRYVSLLSGHGGSGKSTLALTLAAHVACGRDWAGLEVHPGRVVFVSLEDEVRLCARRLREIAASYSLPLERIAQNLLLLDGVTSDAALAAERADYGNRALIATPAMAELADAARGCSLIIIDNAVDALDADHNAQGIVRKFMRGMLGDVARTRGCALLLLAHVDKAGVRKGTAGQSFIGSVAWHNSARSRLALTEVPGAMELRHEKSNLGRRIPAIRLGFNASGVLMPVSGPTEAQAADATGRHADALLGVMRAALAQGSEIVLARTGTATTQRQLDTMPTFPPELRGTAGRLQFWTALDSLLQDGRLQAVTGRPIRATHDRPNGATCAPPKRVSNGV
ncbi:MAG: AAA family ATPase [Vulcanimicrobiaceae bacterium]